MLNLYQTQPDHLPAISAEEMSDEHVLVETAIVKERLADQVLILGHHYQQNDIISFADHRGDSLALAQQAAKAKAKTIVFCGVHFMAETADILTSDQQQVVLPDLNAGCSMADMAIDKDVFECWNFLKQHTDEKIVPITYINCTASLKAFVGNNEGSICTSSNAKKVITWALEQGEKLLFFPDQHLGRNTCVDLGIDLADMVVYDPRVPHGGLTPEKIKKAKVILWYGYCSVHKGFTLDQVRRVKGETPECTVIVHPECSLDVVKHADLAGSTAYIIEQIAQAPKGSHFAVGTEINLVNRLSETYPDKKIQSLSPYQCLCTTMYRVRPRWLLHTLRSIEKGNPINIIKVPEEIQKASLLALERMFKLS